jgi:hypothetical protein
MFSERQNCAAGWLALFIASLFAQPSNTLVVPALVVLALFQATLSSEPAVLGEMIRAWVATPLAVWLIRPA